MNIQPLYDVKERLEYAAIAGTGLLGEDFRLQRAAETIKPLAAASPVFGKISGSVQALLSAPAEERAGLLLDTLALVDAVAYTQAASGVSGDLEPLEYLGSGTYQQLSRGQLQPLLHALASTGSGRLEIVQEVWEHHPDYFTDFRILPALVDGLGDSYSALADLNTKILSKIGSAALPWLHLEFDPAGKREMGRRVEVIAAIEGADAVPWLKEILPNAKKDVRTSAIQAFGYAILTDTGTDPENVQLLLDLAKTERGKNRDAVLEGLAQQDSEAVQRFWKEELQKNGGASAWFLGKTKAGWASELVAEEMQNYLEKILGQDQLPDGIGEDLFQWRQALLGKSSPGMLDFWRWLDDHLADDSMLQTLPDKSFSLENQVEDWLLDSLCIAGNSPLCGLCRAFWERDKEQPYYLPHALVSAVLTRSPEEVYEEFSPYLRTEVPTADTGKKKALHLAVLKGLSKFSRARTYGSCRIQFADHPEIQPFDLRWLSRLTNTVWRPQHRGAGVGYMRIQDFVVPADEYHLALFNLANPDNPEACAIMIPYLRRIMAESGDYYGYGYWILQYHGSFVGVLETSLRNFKNPVYAYHIWTLFTSAAQTLSSQELADGLREVLASKSLRSEDKALMEKAIPAVIEMLEAGQPFPEWGDVWKMRSSLS